MDINTDIPAVTSQITVEQDYDEYIYQLQVNEIILDDDYEIVVDYDKQNRQIQEDHNLAQFLEQKAQETIDQINQDRKIAEQLQSNPYKFENKDNVDRKGVIDSSQKQVETTKNVKQAENTKNSMNIFAYLKQKYKNSKENPKTEIQENLKAEIHENPKTENPKDTLDENPKAEIPENHKTEIQKIQKNPKDTLDENPKAEIQENPKDNLDENPKAEIQENPKDNLEKTPKTEIQENPKDNLDENPKAEIQENNLKENSKDWISWKEIIKNPHVIQRDNVVYDFEPLYPTTRNKEENEKTPFLNTKLDINANPFIPKKNSTLKVNSLDANAAPFIPPKKF